ncbi:MAG: hypothetical protein AB7O49_20250 [Sphingomonadales bacterium]
MSFKSYLMTRKRGPSPQGDFIQHAQGDARMPNVASWRELRAYLLECGAPHGAVESARLVWLAYRAMLKRRAAAPPPLRKLAA